MTIFSNCARTTLIISTTLFTFLGPPRLSGQPSSDWESLDNVPLGSRYNDVYFVNSEIGWIANGSGEIYKTIDGGTSWSIQLDKSVAHFRSIGFVDSLRGWAGNVGFGEFGATDTSALYETSDGGENWSPFNSFNGPKPVGLCGMFVLNDSSVFAVGRVRGPAFFVKTTDRGHTWFSKDLNELAAGLIDVYFFNPDTGLAVGLTNANHTFSSGVVLATTDGGDTWERRHITNRNGEWCWKLSFPSRKVGYASLQRNQLAPIYILKTTDGGLTWQNKFFFSGQYFVQGIGFVTEDIGWIGGNSTYPVYQTTDGGETWQPTNFGTRVNRFRFLGDSLGYAVGETVYKYLPQEPVSVAGNRPEQPVSFQLRQNYPNPFNPTTNIEFRIAHPGVVTLRIFDVSGREVAMLLNEDMPAGNYVVQWDGTDIKNQRVASGSYFCQLTLDNQVKTHKMLLVK